VSAQNLDRALTTPPACEAATIVPAISFGVLRADDTGGSDRHADPAGRMKVKG
jgi:hypothetical protein